MKINSAYKKFIKSKKRIAVLMGGAGSGKSFAVAQKIVMRLLGSDDLNVLVVRKVARTLRNSVHEQIKKIIEIEELKDEFTITTTPLEIICKRNGNKVLFVGLDDPEKIKSITGITCIWIEEATELSEADFTQLNLRVRGETSSYKQIILSFNPISAYHWLKKRFFDVVNDDFFTLITTYRDNKYLTEEDAKALEDLKNVNPVAYDVYANAQWGKLSDTVIYTNWEVKEISQSVYDYDQILIGVDFAYTNPSAVVMVGVDSEENLYVIKEVYEKRLLNTDLIDRIIKEINMDFLIIADSAESDRIAEMKLSGLKVKGVIKDKNSVKNGIDFIKRKKIYIHPDCVNTINEIRDYAWKKDEKTGIIFDEPIKINDHAMDALRYAVTQLMHKKVIKAAMSLY